jgi:hypothetical protein
MAKSLLSLALMATQLFSWSASPLYLCLCGNGSICIDFGPDNCDCCKHSQVDDDCTVHHACKVHEHGDSSERAGHDQNSVAGNPCDCTHIQISQRQISTVVSSSSSPDAERLIAFVDSITCDLSAHVGVPPTDEAGAFWLTQHTPPLLLSQSAPVVMRC